MEKYLTESPVWHEGTKEMLEIEGKTIILEEGEAIKEMTIEVHQSDSNPTLHSVEVCCSMVTNVHPGDASRMQPSTDQIHRYSRFLTKDALDLIHPPHMRVASLCRAFTGNSRASVILDPSTILDKLRLLDPFPLTDRNQISPVGT